MNDILSVCLMRDVLLLLSTIMYNQYLKRECENNVIKTCGPVNIKKLSIYQPFLHGLLCKKTSAVKYLTNDKKYVCVGYI